MPFYNFVLHEVQPRELCGLAGLCPNQPRVTFPHNFFKHKVNLQHAFQISNTISSIEETSVPKKMKVKKVIKAYEEQTPVENSNSGINI